MEITILKCKERNVSFSIPILLLLIITCYLNSYISFILLFFLTIYILFFKNNGKLYNDIFIKIYMVYLLLIAIVGLFNISDSGFWPYFRDLITPIKTIFCFYILYFIKDKNRLSNDCIFKTLFIFSTISCFVSLIFYELLNYIGNSIVVITRGEEFLLALGLYLVFFKQIKLNRIIFYLCSLIIILNFVLAFSRSSLIIFICLTLCSINKSNLKKIFLFILFVSIFLVFVYFIYKDIFINYINEIIYGITEETSYSSEWDATRITNNWRGFEIYCAQFKYSNANIFNKFFGFGAGEFIDAFGEEYRVTSEVGLPYLHNGYYTMLIKAGILGVGLNLLYYFLIIFKSFKNKNSEFRLIFGMTIAMLITEWVIGGPFMGLKMIFIVMLLLNDNNYCKEGLNL